MILTELQSQALVGQQVDQDAGYDPTDPSERYDPEDDSTIMDKEDTRKIRLTLRQLNKLRKLREIRTLEKLQDQKKVRAQFAEPAADDGMSI